jgi:O-antigen/teichoic acid export membrane protein
MKLPPMAKTALYNAVLQGLTLLSKATMMVGLAKYLSVGDVGAFGLFFATVNLAMYAVGLDFYAFSTREILKVSGGELARMVRSQAALHLVSYAIALPLLVLGLFAAASLQPMKLAGWFCILLVLEHLGQELQRLLITLGRSTNAAASLFLRQGLWGVAVPLVMAFDPARRNLETLWWGWSLCEAAGLLLGLWFVRDLAWDEARKLPIDWPWVRMGIRGALPFLTATIALVAMRTIDRYVLKYYWGDEAVGVLTFFLFIRNAIQGLIDSGVVFILQPRIVAAHQSNKLDEYARLMRNLLLSVFAAAAGLSAIAALLIHPVLLVIGRVEYGKHMTAFWSVLALTVVAAVSDVPHVGLYARHFDRAIIAAAVVGLVTALAANLLLVPAIGIVGSVLATTTGFALMAGYRAWVLRAAKES